MPIDQNIYADYLEADEATLRRWAEAFEGECDDGGPGYFSASEGSWSFFPNFPTQKLIESDIFSDAEEAQKWIGDEIQIFIGEEQVGRVEDYRSMLSGPIKDAIIATEVNGKIYIWDGWHRSAASIAKGSATIPVILGTPFV